MVGIYKITNPKGKIYVGQSINIEARFNKYRNVSNKRQPLLYNSLKKYGYENHQFQILEECDVNDLNTREIYWGMFFNVLSEKGLNCRLGNGRGSCSDETKKKISKSLKGVKKSKSHIINLSESKKGKPSKRKGKPDYKQRGKPKPSVSKANKGKPKPNAGPKKGNTVMRVRDSKIYQSVKECMVDNDISKRKMFIMLKEQREFIYLNKNYFKQPK